jgi:hypothetical protein
VQIDRNSLKAIGGGFHVCGGIAKAKGVKVPTGVFAQKEYSGLSALLCSRDEVGADFQLVPNPQADVPMPRCFRLNGTYFQTKKTRSGQTVTPHEARGSRGDDTIISAFVWCARNYARAATQSIRKRFRRIST